MWSSWWKKSQKWQWRSRLSSNLRPKNWTLHDQLPPDYRQIWLTKSVNFEILNFGDWSWPPFSVEVSRWPFTVVGWHWQVDLKILFVRNGPLLRRIWCTYGELCMVWPRYKQNKTTPVLMGRWMGRFTKLCELIVCNQRPNSSLILPICTLVIFWFVVTSYTCFTHVIKVWTVHNTENLSGCVNSMILLDRLMSLC